MPELKISSGVVHDVPGDLAAALLADRSALAIWEEMTPLARNEWICWVEDARKEQTRRQRMARVQTDLKAGKRRPCCWPGCPHREKGNRKMISARDRSSVDLDSLRPIESLLRKCEKAQRKLAPDTWSYRMLQDNIQALRLATALMKRDPGRMKDVSPDEGESARQALASMIRRAEAARSKFAPGASPHTLQQNRLRALRLAKTRIHMAFEIRQHPKALLDSHPSRNSR